MSSVEESLLLMPTISSPLIDFNSGGVLVIEGRSIGEDTDLVFKPALNWCSNTKVAFVYLTIKLDYLNNSSARQLNQLFNILVNNSEVKKIHISWYTDEEDKGQYEMALIFQELHPNIKFSFFRV